MLPAYLQPYSVIFILLLAMGFFIWRKWRYDITAILALTLAAILGVVPVNKVFSGMSNPAVITVVSVMIISHIIAKSKVLNLIINKLEIFTHHKVLHIFTFCFFIAFLSAFMNDIGALGLMLPVSIYTSLKYNRSPSYILMPIAMASILGGLITLIGTPPNLIIASFRAKSTGVSFNMFDFTYVGLGTALIGVLFISLIGWRLLPKKIKQKVKYQPIYTSEIRIHTKSKWIGQTFKQFKNELEKIHVVGLIRRKRKHLLSQSTEIKSGDHFIIETSLDNLQELFDSKDIMIANQISKRVKGNITDAVLLEAIVPTKSNIQNKLIGATNLRKFFKISIIALSQSTKSQIQRIRKLKLRPGDLVLMQCKDNKIIDKLPMIGLIPITESSLQISTGMKPFYPLIIFFIAILLVGSSLIPVQIGFSAAALIIMLLNLNSVKYVYDNFDWSIIILLVAMIPIGDALTQTGGADLISVLILKLSQHLPIIINIAVLMIMTMFLTSFINNAATAIVMAPIAISLAKSMGISVDPFLMAVAIGASCAFLTPIAHQNNLLVMGPGKYKFFDYMRIGIPLDIVVLVVATPLIYWFWYL